MPNYTTKHCLKHGETEFVLEGRGYYRCKKCRTEAVTNNRIKRKKQLIDHFGGCCNFCGYNKCQAALQFHHIDPDKKTFGLSQSGLCRTFDKAIEEANKCILLCANCHSEIEYNKNKKR